MAIIRKHFLVLLFFSTGMTTALVPLVWSGDPGGTDEVIGGAVVASASREVLGLGPIDPLVAESDDATNQAIIDAALVFSEVNSKTLEPVEAEYRAARDNTELT